MRLDGETKADPLVYGGMGYLVRSQALIRLEFGGKDSTGLLALGSREEGKFHARQGRELAHFSGARHRMLCAFMARPSAITDSEPDSPVASDLQGAVSAWRAWLESERRASPHTLAAYARDLDGFLGFRGECIGYPRGSCPFSAPRGHIVLSMTTIFVPGFTV